MENTIKKLIDSCDLETVFQKLYIKHNHLEDFPIEKIRRSYGEVCLRLVLQDNDNINKNYEVLINKEDLGEGKYIYVCLLNLNYQIPDANADLNDEKYNKYISLSGIPWGELVNMKISLDESCKELSNEDVLAEALWELTFFGFSEQETNQFFNSLKETYANEISSI